MSMTEIENLQDRIDTLESRWTEFLDSCDRLGVLSDVRRASRLPKYQIAICVVCDLLGKIRGLERELKTAKYWQL